MNFIWSKGILPVDQPNKVVIVNSRLSCLFEVSAVSGSIVGEAVARGADWAESARVLDCGDGVVVEPVEQLATASAHVPTPARKTAGFFMDCTPLRSTQIRGDIKVCRCFQHTAAATENATVMQA